LKPEKGEMSKAYFGIALNNLRKDVKKKPVSKYRPRAGQNFFGFGNSAIPVGPVAFRPTIARGLALSALFAKILI
jgi:hypothetical protein